MQSGSTVILDPIPKQQNLHDKRLNEIIEAAPRSTIQDNRGFKAKALSFCVSRIGLTLFSWVVFFILLLIIQPQYIFKKNKDNTYSLNNINYGLVCGIALVGALFVFFIPYIINGRKAAT